ncbi:MAG: hypothetical protein H8E40_08265 [Chloroflexi bacterium]|nr:hypothetical protein [Chloroflexota bacterium]
MSPVSKYGVIAEFPSEKRDEVWAELVAKSGGLCQLCEDPIDITSDDIIIEHKDKKLGTVIPNLYLAHRTCNSSKGDLPYLKAKSMIKFKKFCESKGYNISFDNILDKYVALNNRKPIQIKLENDRVQVTYSNEHKVEANVFVDPATSTQFFFTEVPIEYIHNDIEVQPRRIDWNHTWSMALDFEKHPIHEPSSCRVQLDDTQVGKLLQFDGQHKTTAQILLGRKTIPAKIYVNPEILMIKDLILAIQNRIIKKPLAPPIHLVKMRDVYLAKLQISGATSEKAFVDSYLQRERANAKKEVFASIYKNIIDSDCNEFRKYIQPEGTRAGKYPLSMNLVLNYIMKSLVCQELQTTQIGGVQDFRVNECENVEFILNILADELLENGKWPLDSQMQESSTEHMKARRFFKSGAVRYWPGILRGAIVQRLTLIETSDQSRLLLRPLTDSQKDLIRALIVRLTNHPIWTDNDGTIDNKLSANAKEISETLFREGSPRGYRIPLTVGYLLGVT